MKKIFLLACILSYTFCASADEGMWILKELNKQSAARMQELGFSFPIDSIYSENNASLKDAVVIFGGGCTGVAVSNEGLIFTNHHCGYDAIQKHSSVEHDYLKNGFVSQTNSEELFSDGLSISFLKKTEDITQQVTSGISSEASVYQREHHIDSVSNEILKTYADNEFIKARIVPFYAGNKYYLVIYDVFKDVRMVFAPPSSIGKFGGETDNWMWPRHTGDFSVFRVYANKDNQPANYSADNVPYTPKYFVPVSLQGYEDKGYAMTIGYPGSTDRYLSSWGIRQLIESENKPRIEVRGVKQAIWKDAMNASDAVRIKYASKYARSSNYWKNSMGMNTALVKLDVISEKEKLESRFSEWLAKDSVMSHNYGESLPLLKEAYIQSMKPMEVMTYFSETFSNGIELIRFANTAMYSDLEDTEAKIQYVRTRLGESYKNYVPELDRQVTPSLLKLYAERVPEKYLPSIYKTIDKKFKGDYVKYTEWLFENTKLTDLDSFASLLKTGDEKKIMKDPVFELANAIQHCRLTIMEEFYPHLGNITLGSRLFMAGLMEMDSDKAFSPDANFTQRLSYGTIGGYKPFDAARYDYFSTSQGVLEKENPNNPEFNVQQYVLDNIRSKNWGGYADKDGTMHVNFLSNNDITGGNSGSPVFNGKAHLIGLAFDGNWEALSGDIVFEPELQRTISVDIRYVLYTIDKVMNCSRLIKELKLVK